MNSANASYLNWIACSCSLTCRKSMTSRGPGPTQPTNAGEMHGTTSASLADSGWMKPASTQRSSSAATKERSAFATGYGLARRRGRPRGVIHGRRKPNLRARRTQRDAPMSRQASWAALTRAASGKPAGASPPTATPGAPVVGAGGAGETPRVSADLHRRVCTPAALVAAAAAGAASTCLPDLVRRDDLVEGAVAHVDRLDLEAAAGAKMNVGGVEEALL